LKTASDEPRQIASGRLFQARGSATANALHSGTTLVSAGVFSGVARNSQWRGLESRRRTGVEIETPKASKGRVWVGCVLIPTRGCNVIFFAFNVTDFGQI